MCAFLVYSTTHSRLHADLLVVRLKRAGLPTQSISVIHPTSLRPNSTLCWIKGSASFGMGSGSEVVVAGKLGSKLKAETKSDDCSLAQALSNVGLSRRQSQSVNESLLENQIVVAVEVHRESDLQAIYHTLLGFTVETAESPKAKRERFSPAAVFHKYLRVYGAVELAMAQGAMA